MYFGKKLKNPWKSNTLEWTVPVEHIHGNYSENSTYRWAYDYSKPGKKEDYVPQSIPIAKEEKLLNIKLSFSIILKSTFDYI